MKRVPLWVKLLLGIGLIASILVGLSFVPTKDVAYAPVDPISLDSRIKIDGKPAGPLQGQLFLVGVTERNVNFLQRHLLDLVDSSIDFGPAPASGSAAATPADINSMARAKEIAAGVALDLAGYPVEWSGNGATIDKVFPNTPAQRAGLQAGDVIVRVNDVDVDTSVEAAQIINRKPPGSLVRLGIRRAGQAVQARLTTIPPVEGDAVNKSRIGIAISTLSLDVKLPKRVSVNSGEVVGPSAGLPFALYTYDAVDDSVDLLRGRYVVATGALAPDGQVAEVGRVRQKAISAQRTNRDLFLVPIANAEEARAAVRSACKEGEVCVKIVPVSSVQDAVEALQLDDGALEARVAG